MMNLSDLFSPDQPLLEMVIRGSAIYWFLLIVFRFVLRRDVGSMSMADLLFIVLVADASSNAMQGEYRSVTNGVTLLATLIGWNYLLDLLGYRYEWVARVLAPPARAAGAPRAAGNTHAAQGAHQRRRTDGQAAGTRHRRSRLGPGRAARGRRKDQRHPQAIEQPTASTATDKRRRVRQMEFQ
ncbi:hypothetical protein [Variovorax sp. CCNWLW186]|uniref:hypothetical protein n=1 Tax=Variovorax sp. CCNWLW186 TaxID=3127473 RepID=UPI003FD38EB6